MPVGIEVSAFVVSVRTRSDVILYRLVDTAPVKDFPVQFLNKDDLHGGDKQRGTGDASECAAR